MIGTFERLSVRTKLLLLVGSSLAALATVTLPGQILGGPSQRPRGDSPQSFLWSDAGAQGYAVAFLIDRKTTRRELPTSMEFTLQMSEVFAREWSLYAADTYYMEGGKRRRVYKGGPYEVTSASGSRGPICRSWQITELKPFDYYAIFLFRNTRPDADYDAFKSDICGGKSLCFKSYPLPE